MVDRWLTMLNAFGDLHEASIIYSSSYFTRPSEGTFTGKRSYYIDKTTSTSMRIHTTKGHFR